VKEYRRSCPVPITTYFHLDDSTVNRILQLSGRAVENFSTELFALYSKRATTCSYLYTTEIVISEYEYAYRYAAYVYDLDSQRAVIASPREAGSQ
jgi:hypothetical protein